MIKEKRILSYFIGWLILGLIICFIGIKNTYAATTTTYENIGYLNDVTILYSLSDDPPYPIEIPRNGEYQLYNVEKIIVQIDNYTFSGGTTYNLELSLPITTLNNNMYSVIDENGNKCSIGTTDVSGSSYPNYSFNCNKNTNSLTLNIYNTDGSDILNAGIFRWNYIYLRKQLTTTDTSILENQQSQMIEQNQQIIQGQDEIKDTIKDELNSCRPSVNLFDKDNANIITVHLNSINTITYSPSNRSIYIPIKPNTTYTISRGEIGLPFVVGTTENIPSADSTYYNRASNENASSLTITSSSNSNYLVVWYWNGNSIFTEQELLNTLQIQEGSVVTKYETYGEEICTNKLDEQNETQKGIWATIKDLPNAFMNMLKGLFIPGEGYFENWFNSLKAFFEIKLGFLATPFTIIIDFINRYLNLNPAADIIINIPDINVPNFEEHVIIKATTFNWSQLLQSKESLNTLWQLYLSFVDVFLILNFINLCENKYNRIFGGDTSQYEYYTVEESYTINDNTGEATNHRLNERITTRKKVV